MNKDEYNILVDIAKQWKLNGKDIDNPQQFIDDKIRDKKIKYNDSGHVVSIDLSENQLSGPIPSSIGSLSQLEKLYLSYNQLSGPIPESTAKLTKVKVKFLAMGNIGFEMNKDEYNILVDIAKQWKQDGKDIDNPQQFMIVVMLLVLFFGIIN